MTVFSNSPLSAVLTDSRGYVFDSTTPLPVNPAEAGAANLTTSQVALNSSTATQLLAANATRRAALVTNNDSAINIFVGKATVTTATGHKLAPGANVSIPYVGAIYAIAASATPTASASEVYD